jgi:hypothetical protein
MYLGGNHHNHNDGKLFSNPAFKCVSRIICINDRRLRPPASQEKVNP